MQLNTFSVIAYDPDEQSWGVAVASKFLAAGAVVSWAKAGVGAVATQSYAKVSFGADGLDLMAQGQPASDALTTLLQADDHAETRQVALIDAQGTVAAHTGAACHEWAGHRTGKHFSVQGNILTGAEVLDAMADSFQNAQGELSDRLVSALRAAESAGGDKRGKQSAAVLVVKEKGGYGGDNDRYIDLRVDDHEQPVKKLWQLLESHHLFFGNVKTGGAIPIDATIARELQEIMLEQGYMGGQVNGEWDDITKQAFWVLVGNENLEERWNLQVESDKIDPVILDYLRKRFR